MADNNATVSKKPIFDLSTAVDSSGESIPMDEKERLTGIPSNWTKVNARLRRANFADKGHFYEWLITLESTKMARIDERIGELHIAAEEARRGPDPQKKALRKLARMAKVAAELRAQLEAEGVDLSELDA